MKINEQTVRDLKPCKEGLYWYLENGSDDLLDTLIRINEYDSSYARWGFTRLMNRMQRVEIAIFCAESVIDIFENKYPDDSRPRKAIEAAKKYLDNPSDKTAADAKDAGDAAYAAYATATYATATYATTAAAHAATAATAATYATVTTYATATYTAAAYATYATATYTATAYATYAAAAKKQLQIDIIHKAVEILDRDSQCKKER